jgi:hypothetical protein
MVGLFFNNYQTTRINNGNPLLYGVGIFGKVAGGGN